MKIDPTRTNLLRTLICRWLHIERTFDYVSRYCLDGDFKMKPLTLEHLKKELRAVLLSRRGGVALDQLEAEYLNLVGLLHLLEIMFKCVFRLAITCRTRFNSMASPAFMVSLLPPLMFVNFNGEEARVLFWAL